MSPETVSEYIPTNETEISFGEFFVSSESFRLSPAEQERTVESAVNDPRFVELSSVKGGEPEDWKPEYSGDGYTLENSQVIHKETGEKWEGFDAEVIAQLQEGRERVRLPDHDDGEKVYVTYLLQGPDYSISYEILAMEIPKVQEDAPTMVDISDYRIESATTYLWNESFDQVTPALEQLELSPVAVAEAEQSIETPAIETGTEPIVEIAPTVPDLALETPREKAPLADVTGSIMHERVQIFEALPVLVLPENHRGEEPIMLKVSEPDAERTPLSAEHIARSAPAPSREVVHMNITETTTKRSPEAAHEAQRFVPDVQKDVPKTAQLELLEPATTFESMPIAEPTAEIHVRSTEIPDSARKTESNTIEDTVAATRTHTSEGVRDTHMSSMSSQEIQQAVQELLQSEPLVPIEDKELVESTVSVAQQRPESATPTRQEIDQKQERETITLEHPTLPIEDRVEETVALPIERDEIPLPVEANPDVPKNFESRKNQEMMEENAVWSRTEKEVSPTLHSAEILQFPRARFAPQVDEIETSPRARRSRNGITLSFAQAA